MNCLFSKSHFFFYFWSNPEKTEISSGSLLSYSIWQVFCSFFLSSMDWPWTLTGCGFRHLGQLWQVRLHGLRKIKDTVTCQCLMAKRSSLLLAGGVNFYTCIFHLRRMLKGKKFKYKTACCQRGITFSLYSEEDIASDTKFRERNDDWEIILSSCQKLLHFIAILGHPGVLHVPIPAPDNLLFGCWRQSFRQVEQVVTRG